ncbi:MAG: cytochrome b562 [Terrimicrobiaceae bacterium]
MKTDLNHRLARPVVLTLLISLATLSGMKADTPLEKNMERMKKACQELSLGLEKPQENSQATYLTLAGIIKTSAIEARDLVPKSAAALPPDQKAAMIKSYKESMGVFVGSVDGLIQNIKDSKWEEARKDIVGLKNEMKDGHREFRKDK